MYIKSNATIVPAIKIGSPITLTTVDTISYVDDSVSQTYITFDQNINDTQCSSDYNTSSTQTTRDASYLSCYEKYSERAVITKETTGTWTIASNDRLHFEYNGTTLGDLESLISGANGTAAYTYVQYDFRSFNGGSNDPNYTSTLL